MEQTQVKEARKYLPFLTKIIGIVGRVYPDVAEVHLLAVRQEHRQGQARQHPGDGHLSQRNGGY